MPAAPPIVEAAPQAAPLWGPLALPDGGTRFRLWAPDCAHLTLEIEDRAPLPMHPLDAGWFAVETQAPPGTAYRFRLPSGATVADPASRRQRGPVDGWSLLVDPAPYPWRQTDWRGRRFEETVLYELHVGLMGGFAGVIAHLPRLAALGVTALELMPVNSFPGGRNWGYDGVLPFAPEDAYGTPDDLKRLVDEAHRHGLMVVMDVVYNHFGPSGNWLHHYCESFFRDDIHTPWGPAIDFRQPSVRRFFTENALMWLHEYNMDGLRLDAVHTIHDPFWLNELADELRASIPPDRRIALILENENNVAFHLEHHFDAQWNDDFHHALHVMLTGETHSHFIWFAEKPAEKLALALHAGYSRRKTLDPARYGPWATAAPPQLHPTAFISFLQNHDQIGNRAYGDRKLSMADEAAMRAAIAFQLLLPHIPMLFMGEEVGSKQPFLYFINHDEDLAKLVRDGRRGDFAGFPGFDDPAKLASLPDPNAAATFAHSQVDFAGPESGPWIAYYQRLLELRHRHIVPRLAGATALGAAAIDSCGAAATYRMGDGQVLAIALNLGPAAHPLPPLPAADTAAIPPEAVRLWGALDATGQLPPRQAVAWLLPAPITSASPP